jgi:sec-independent protein translocase protein TatC
MVDPAEAISKARAAVSERAELPGMSLMEHLDELRRRIVHSAIYLCIGFAVTWIFRDRFVAVIQAPLVKLGKTLVFTHPMDALNLQLQVALIGGAIVASPFILYQVWLFIAPGLYQKERRFVIPFMAATVGLFLSGAGFGYFYVLPGAIKILVVEIGKNFTPLHHPGPGHQLRDADSHLLPGAVRHCQP